MIVDELDIGAELGDYNLGGRSPPEVVSEKLLQMRVPITAIWDGELCRWHLYRIMGDKLIWQNTAPKGDLTAGIVEWLQKFDSSKQGTLDDSERVKDFEYYFKHVRLPQDIVDRRKRTEETMYECRSINQYLKRIMSGNRQCVVPAGPIVGMMKNGKAIRAYRS